MDQINRIGVGGTGEEENKHPTSRAGREKWKARGKSGVTKQVHKKQEGKEQSKKVLCFPPAPPPPKKKSYLLITLMNPSVLECITSSVTLCLCLNSTHFC